MKLKRRWNQEGGSIFPLCHNSQTKFSQDPQRARGMECHTFPQRKAYFFLRKIWLRILSIQKLDSGTQNFYFPLIFLLLSLSNVLWERKKNELQLVVLDYCFTLYIRARRGASTQSHTIRRHLCQLVSSRLVLYWWGLRRMYPARGQWTLDFMHRTVPCDW